MAGPKVKDTATLYTRGAQLFSLRGQETNEAPKDVLGHVSMLGVSGHNAVPDHKVKLA